MSQPTIDQLFNVWHNKKAQEFQKLYFNFLEQLCSSSVSKVQSHCIARLWLLPSHVLKPLLSLIHLTPNHPVARSLPAPLDVESRLVLISSLDFYLKMGKHPDKNQTLNKVLCLDYARQAHPDYGVKASEKCPQPLLVFKHLPLGGSLALTYDSLNEALIQTYQVYQKQKEGCTLGPKNTALLFPEDPEQDLRIQILHEAFEFVGKTRQVLGQSSNPNFSSIRNRMWNSPQ